MSQDTQKKGSQSKLPIMQPSPDLLGNGVKFRRENQGLDEDQSYGLYQFMPNGEEFSFGDSYALWSKNRHLENQVQTACRVMNEQEKLSQQQEDLIKQLRKRIEELELLLVQERACVATLAGMRRAGELAAVSNQDFCALQYSPSHAAARTTVLTRQSEPQLSSPVRLPYTPITPQVPIESSSTVKLAPPPNRRHKRTETPEQRSLKQFTNGVPIYTMGMEQQDDRGLLHDFFEDVRRWARFYTKARMESHEAQTFATTPDLVEIMANKSDVTHMLVDNDMRKDIVACMVTRHIVANAMSDNFLWNSGHRAKGACNDLYLEFAHTGDNEIARKHEICQTQRDLYTKLKQDPDHKEWRSTKAEENCTDLLSKLDFLLEPCQVSQRDHVLSELYVKGYRIGFRLRMEAVKWQIVWPTAGTDVNPSMMVNQTRNLLGDPMKTFNEIQRDSKKFFVRFAVTPTFIKYDFSSGTKTETVTHSSMVHIGRRGIFSHQVDAAK